MKREKKGKNMSNNRNTKNIEFQILLVKQSFSQKITS